MARGVEKQVTGKCGREHGLGRPVALLAVAMASALVACEDDSRQSHGRDLATEGGIDARPPIGVADDAGRDAVPSLRFDAHPLKAPLPCNGEVAYCTLRYAEITFPATHGATANSNPPFVCTTQQQTVRTQLDQGIRALHIQVFETLSGDPSPPPVDASLTDGGPEADTLDAGPSALVTCYEDCASGSLPVRDAVTDVKEFLDANPRDIVTLLLEGRVDAGGLVRALSASSLDALSLPWVAGDAWPTLGEMVDAGTRLVVFADVTGTPPGWVLPLWTTVAATGTTFASTAAMMCDVARGDPKAPLYWVNHYLVDPAAPLGCGGPALAHEANAEPFFMNRVNVCRAQQKKPSFVSVDFYEDGDVRDLTRALNLGL